MQTTKSKESKKKKWISLLIGLVIVTTVAVLGYTGIGGEFFKGMIGVRPIKITLPDQKATLAYLDHTGGGVLENYIYEASEPAQDNDVVFVYRVKYDGLGYVEFSNLTVNNEPYTASNCSSTVDTEFRKCDINNFPVARGGTLVRLNKTNTSLPIDSANNPVTNYTLIAQDSNNDGIFSENEFVNKEWTRVNGGEMKVFAILNDTRTWANMANKHFTGKVYMKTGEFKLVDSSGKNINITFDPISVSPQSINFK